MPNPFLSRRFWITLLVLLAANIFITNVLLAPAHPTTITLPYNIFKEQVTADNVVTVTTTGDAITGVTKTAVAEPGTGTKATHFTTQHPSFANDNLETLLEHSERRTAQELHSLPRPCMQGSRDLHAHAVERDLVGAQSRRKRRRRRR